ncbi:hypothetical protein DGo_PB0357 (plasmid) [Deinococcus gobiensis I-0]|uniref:Uncharacterized protein n=1 Tax=Deinococcus gobiensis (strain DSM 21396 / JCM 16679 / CGMCC 1.7299 / I-0) TaxID=745776 RepID=H8H279_DEIGI|nr:hypothetical protein DGo_PB0357 [Deinococcus gobiensis I-0]
MGAVWAADAQASAYGGTGGGSQATPDEQRLRETPTTLVTPLALW